MRLHEQGKALLLEECPVPVCSAEEVLIKVSACAVCRTDLHVCDGDLTKPKLPLIPGHEIVGQVVASGENVQDIKVGERVGVPWLGYTCGECHYCRTGNEGSGRDNLKSSVSSSITSIESIISIEALCGEIVSGSNTDS
jgi:propanol-preferring alcohol dehydrogenase